MKIIIIVRAIIHDDSGALLLLRRSPENANYDGWYELPGGKCDPADSSEQPLEALRREVQEESGVLLDTTDCQLIKVFSDMVNEDVTYFNLIYRSRQSISEQEVKLSAEHDSFVFVPYQEIQQLHLTPYTLRALEEYLDEEKTEDSSTKNILIVDKKASNNHELAIYTDGGSRGNPGPSASGFVILNKQGEVLEEGGEYLGITTNNQAEYQAVKLALEQARKYHPSELTFRIDSELVVKQMNGEYQIRNRELWPVHARIRELISGFSSVKFVHIAREGNVHADSRVNEILDSHQKL